VIVVTTVPSETLIATVKIRRGAKKYRIPDASRRRKRLKTADRELGTAVAFIQTAMTSIDAKSLLALRSQILERNAVLSRAAQPAQSARPTDFGSVMNDTIGSVNAEQGRAEQISAAYERGETTDIAAVMLQRQKASISFEATMQVRNRLLSAYKDIMNMPV
jgi:flagellar hook-basal body complex protein FliE